MTLTLRKIAEVMGGTFVGDTALLDTAATSTVRDNREAVAGSLFLCFRGERVDGHDFANDAFARGAICAIAERDIENSQGAYILVPDTAAALRRLGAYYRSQLMIPIIGVVGSVGKTTAKELISAALSRRFNVHKTDKNLNNELGVPLTLLGIGEAHTAAVVEMGISDYGEMTRLGEMVHPDIVLFTNIGHAHLETLGDLNGVLRAKSEVFATMKPGGTAVLCGDDELLRTLDPGVKTLTFGTQPHNDYRAESVTFGENNTQTQRFTVTTPTARLNASIDAYGLFLASSAAGAVAVAELLGVAPQDIAAGLADYRTLNGRANLIETTELLIIDDCYNANPNSVAAALRSLATIDRRRVAILGDMKELGARANELHRDIGLLAGELGIDVLICCGEKAEFYLKGFVASQAERPVYHFPFRNAFLEQLPTLVKKGDAILVKASHSMNFDEVVGLLQRPHATR